MNETLRSGWHLFPSAEGTWMLVSPEERFIRLRIEPEKAERLALRLSGESALEGMDDDLHPLLATFAQQGLLAPEEELPADLSGRHVLVRGAGPIAAAVGHLLETAGVGRVEQRRAGNPDLLEGSDLPHLIIACAGWLPDAEWRRLDAWCGERRIAWTGCFAEGLRFYLGPLAIPGRTAGYADVRARRLAAAPFPAELEAWWRFLDQGRAIPPVPWPDAAGVAALAAALASDALAWLTGAPLPHEGEQLSFDPARWEWRRHPVLAVPRNLMLEPAA